MTCKDCINEDYCKSMCSVYYDHLSQECEMFCRNKICEHRYDNADKNCKGFKDKSKIIELPCKVGDTVYCFCEAFKNIFSYFIEQIEIQYSDCPSGYYTTFCTNCDEVVDCIYFDLDYIGKTVFLTREEAEAKLKEMNGQ